MKIVVLIKEVPDTDEVKMDPQSGTMIREGAGGVVNPLDLHALEAAEALRGCGEIALLSMGPAKAERSLREGLAMGADRAFLATDRAFAGSDSWATALVLASAIRKIGIPDLILAGEKATDGETGQVGCEVAALLGMPVVTHVTGIELCSGGIRATSTLEDGLLVQEISLPCVMTVLSALNDPSMATLAGKKRARTMPVEILTADSLALDESSVGIAGSPTRVVRIESPQLARSAERYSSTSSGELAAGLDRVVDMLTEMAMI